MDFIIAENETDIVVINLETFKIIAQDNKPQYSGKWHNVPRENYDLVKTLEKTNIKAPGKYKFVQTEIPILIPNIYGNIFLSANNTQVCVSEILEEKTLPVFKVVGNIEIINNRYISSNIKSATITAAINYMQKNPGKFCGGRYFRDKEVSQTIEKV